MKRGYTTYLSNTCTRESFWIWEEVFGSLGHAVGKEITADELEVEKKLSDLRVGEDESVYNVQMPAARLHT